MPSLKTIGAFLLVALTGLLAFFKAQASRAQAQRDQARQAADIAKQVNEAHAAADQAARKLAKKHRQETIDEKQKLDKDIRDQLDNNW
jgi:uncharacterized iron-regulated membrane protein